MDDEMRQPRADAVAALSTARFLVPWAFEYTPASSEPPDSTYLRKVRDADMVVWLVGSRSTPPVIREIREAMAYSKPMIVIRLAATAPDEATRALLDEVAPRSKWVSVAPRDVREALALTLSDEIIRAWRGKPGRTRAALLDERGRLSRARCIQRWRAAGLSRSEALELADDLNVGAPPDSVRPTSEQPLVVIEADVGAGKSLTGERLLQEGIAEALIDPDAPVPIWLAAREAQEGLLAILEARAEGIGDLSRQGGMVVIDGADEVGTGAAGSLLNEARIAAELGPRMRIVVTSRPLAPLERAEEVVHLPALDEEEALAIVSRLTGRTTTGFGWPESVKNAICRPLFAVLLAVYLRSNPSGVPRSTGEMLRYLVRSAIPEGDDQARRVLRRLGRLSTDRGDAPVPVAEVAEGDVLQRLRDSGLVVESRGSVGFALPILTQWFASDSLRAGEPTIQELVTDAQRRDLWRYALVIALGEISFDESTDVLEPLVRADPAFAAELVTEALPEYAHPGEGLKAPPPIEAAHAIRRTAAAWLAGLGPVAPLIPIARSDGTPLPLAAKSFEDSLMTFWRAQDDVTADEMELPADIDIFSAPPGWGPGRVSRPTADAAWPWRWSLHEIVDGLKPWVKERLLPDDQGPLYEERAWAEALAVLGAGSLHPGPLPLNDIESRLSLIPDHAIFRDYRRIYDLGALRGRVRELRAQGRDDLPAPWPAPDEDFGGGGWVWDPFSPGRLLDRASVVYDGALRGYVSLVERWLPSLAPRLTTYVTLPALLTGTLSFVKRSGVEGGPVLSWHFEAFHEGEDLRVELRLDEGDTPERFEPETMRRSYERLKAFRPHARRWINPTFHSEILEVFGATPATDIAFKWLEDDLKRVRLLA